MQRFVKYVFTSLHVGRTTSFCLSELAVGQALLIFETVSFGTILNIPPQTQGRISQEFATQNQKMWTKQRFCKNVSEVVTTRDKLDSQSASKNTTPHIVIINFDVLGSRMADRIRGQSNSRIIITPKNGNVRKKQLKLLEDNVKPS